MGNYSKFVGARGEDSLAFITSFDPGGGVGFCVLGIEPAKLASGNVVLNREEFDHIEYGTINAMTTPDNVAVAAEMHQGHPGLNMAAENAAVKKMLSLTTAMFPTSAIVFEDFIVDFKQITQARDALSPVRLTAAFSYGLYATEPFGIGPFGAAQQRIWIQNRSLAKTTCTDVRLKHWGMHDQSSGPHARDATRHAIYFMKGCQGTGMKAREKRWRAWPHLFQDPVVAEIKTQYPPKKKKLGEVI